MVNIFNINTLIYILILFIQWWKEDWCSGEQYGHCGISSFPFH